MTTTVTTHPPIHQPRRRTLFSVALVAVLALGAGAAAGRLTSSDSSTSAHTNVAAATVTSVDVHALWDQLASMPASQRDVVVAGLSHDVRTRLQAIGEEIGVAAEDR
jgi:hypothetical protein